MKKAIIFNASHHYITPLETTIKSIMTYHRDIKFYILNEDIPQEWFLILSQRLKKLGSEIINAKIDPETVKSFALPTDSLHYSAYFRYFIGDVVEEDRAVYLDCDMIVTDSIDELFTIDLGGFHLAAVEDYPNKTFNAGMLVIDVAYWREQNLSQTLLELTALCGEVEYGDQGILNRYFGKEWLVLDKTYNLMVAQDSLRNGLNDPIWFQQDYRDIPKIIHYITEKKPWTQLKLNRYLHLWWFYYGLSWEDIILGKVYKNLTFEEMIDEPEFHAAIFTESAYMIHLDTLIAAFPDVKFHIGCLTLVWQGITNLEANANVAVYPAFNTFTKRELLDKIDFYLDINLRHEHDGVIGKALERQIPIFSFEQTKHSDYGMIFADHQVNEMIAAIRSLLEQKKQEKNRKRNAK